MRTVQLIHLLVDSLHCGQHGSTDMIECLFTPIYNFAGSRYYNDTQFVQMQLTEHGTFGFSTIASYDSKAITIKHITVNILRGSSAMFTASVFLVK
jgi:hypothetical protein